MRTFIATTRLRFPQVASTACCAVPLRSADADGEDAGAGSGQDGNVEKQPFRCWKTTCFMKFHVKNVKKPWNSRFETKRVKQEPELSNLPHLSSSFTWFNFYRRRSLWLSALVPTVPTVAHAEMSLSTLTPETLQNAKGKAAVDTIRSMICWETICNLPDDFYKRSGNYHHEWSYYILNYTYNRYVYIYIIYSIS